MLQKVCSIEQNSMLIKTNSNNFDKDRRIMKTLKYIDDFERGNYQSNGKEILNLQDRNRILKNLALF